MKIFDPGQLTHANGDNGAPVFVAVDGKVYDVSSSKRWPKGRHMNRHRAGEDLSTDIRSAPHGLEVLERFQQVGTLQAAPAVRYSGIRGRIETWLERIPFLRRHPHPAVVHFPLALPIAAVLFEVLALVTGSTATEWAAYCCLLLGVLVVPAAVATGYFTWWINYERSSSPTIVKKRRLAWVALFLGLLAVTVRTFMVTDPLRVGDLDMILYLADLGLLAAVVSWVGFLGGTLTFPYERH
jgi:predicted heme/steroid binding protein/uncharacterized membrane protein